MEHESELFRVTRALIAEQRRLADSTNISTLLDRRAIAAAKNLVNQGSLPSADGLLDAITSF